MTNMSIECSIWVTEGDIDMVQILAFIMCLVLIFSVSGVYATWKYSELSPQAAQQDVSVSLMVFDYPPEQILPGGDTQEAPLGENHLALINLILCEDDKGYGLNISNNVLIHKYLKNEDVIFSNQKISGGNLKFILDPHNNTHGLYYCIEKISDTLYYSYTFDINHLSTASGTDEYITVYRTSLVKTDEWRATTTYEGIAKTRSLSSMGVSADSQSLKYSIDVTTWRLPFTQ